MEQKGHTYKCHSQVEIGKKNVRHYQDWREGIRRGWLSVQIYGSLSGSGILVIRG